MERARVFWPPAVVFHLVRHASLSGDVAGDVVQLTMPCVRVGLDKEGGVVACLGYMRIAHVVWDVEAQLVDIETLRSALARACGRGRL